MPQNVNASESAVYISAVGLDVLEDLLTAESEGGLHTGSIAVDSYTNETAGANEDQVVEFVELQCRSFLGNRYDGDSLL